MNVDAALIAQIEQILKESVIFVEMTDVEHKYR